MQIYGAPPYYYPPQMPPQVNPLQQINETIAFYQGLKKQLKDEDKESGDKKKKSNWSFAETFIIVSLGMPFLSLAQLLIMWKIMH